MVCPTAHSSVVWLLRQWRCQVPPGLSESSQQGSGCGRLPVGTAAEEPGRARCGQ